MPFQWYLSIYLWSALLHVCLLFNAEIRYTKLLVNLVIDLVLPKFVFYMQKLNLDSGTQQKVYSFSNSNKTQKSLAVSLVFFLYDLFKPNAFEC